MLLIENFGNKNEGRAPLIDDLGGSAYQAKIRLFRSEIDHFQISNQRQIFKSRCKAPEISGDPLQIFLSSNESKTSIFEQTKYMRTLGTKRRSVKCC